MYFTCFHVSMKSHSIVLRLFAIESKCFYVIIYHIIVYHIIGVGVGAYSFRI